MATVTVNGGFEMTNDESVRARGLSIPKARRHEMLRRMFRIRLFEERLQSMIAAAQIPGARAIQCGLRVSAYCFRSSTSVGEMPKASLNDLLKWDLSENPHSKDISVIVIPRDDDTSRSSRAR